VYPIAITVEACLQAGTGVEVAWTIASSGLGPHPSIEAVAFTAGGGRVGSVLDGALDSRLAELAALVARGPARVAELEIGPVDALISGLPADGTITVVVAPADALPAELWPALAARRPLALVASVTNGEIAEFGMFTAEEDSLDAAVDPDLAAARARQTSETTILDDGRILTVLNPQPQFVLAGGGDYAEAIADLAEWLGWEVLRVDDPVTASARAGALGPSDAVVVVGHEHEITGEALAAALASQAGYVGALGSPRVRQQRAAWLAARGVTDLARLHTPAGLDIGSREPREVALSVLAEVFAVRTGASGRALAEAGLPSRSEQGDTPPHRC
jgi:xanthine dehydrogenase accessory factor